MKIQALCPIVGFKWGQRIAAKTTTRIVRVKTNVKHHAPSSQNASMSRVLSQMNNRFARLSSQAPSRVFQTICSRNYVTCYKRVLYDKIVFERVCMYVGEISRSNVITPQSFGINARENVPYDSLEKKITKTNP